MVRDPIIEEVRQVRHAIEAVCEDDPEKYYEHLQEVQDRYPERVVRRAPKPALSKRKLAV